MPRATTVALTIVATADMSGVLEKYVFMVSRAVVTCAPYAIHNARMVSNCLGGLGTYAQVIHPGDSWQIQVTGNAEFSSEQNLHASVRMEGVARFRAIGTYTIDGSVVLWGAGDAIFQALLNFGGLLPSGSVHKSYVVNDSDVRYLNPSSVGLALGSNSRYLPSTLLLIGDLLSMCPTRFPFIEEDPTDSIYVVRFGEENRLDLLSMRAYGTAHLWWVIAAANGVRDPFNNPIAGTNLRLPALSRIYREIVGRVA